ncbi:hypothetical protein GVAV_002339 [Gurleya vavrai]
MVDKAFKSQKLQKGVPDKLKNLDYYEEEIMRLKIILFKLEKWINSTETNSDVKYYKREMTNELEDLSSFDIGKIEKIIEDFEVRKYGFEGGDLDDWSGESCETKEIAKKDM